MLTLWGTPSGRTCEGIARRDFLRIGALGAGAFSLPNLLRARARAAEGGQPTANTSVIWLWLGGGASQIETFDPKMGAPAEFRSTIGAVDGAVSGMQFGGLFPRMAQAARGLTIVRSFSHQNSGHSGGTHFVMTGYDHPPADQGALPIRPSIGAIAARADRIIRAPACRRSSASAASTATGQVGLAPATARSIPAGKLATTWTLPSNFRG